MKKIAILSFMLLLLVACHTNTSNQKETSVIMPAAESSSVPDIHNSQNSVNYTGVYKGELPSASGPGMIVTIELKEDGTFKEDVVYKKDNSTYTTKGKYTWNTTGSIITLEGLKYEPNRYRVGGGILIQLDMEGNEIKSKTGFNYTLKKQE